jgi:hypothetical protein
MKGKVISIFDPARGAYFEGSIATAKKFIASAEELKKKIATMEAKAASAASEVKK